MDLIGGIGTSVDAVAAAVVGAEPTTLLGAIAVALAAVCILLIRLKRFGAYVQYVYMAFAWVEKTIPDTVGVSEADPVAFKMAHKLDQFCKMFIKFAADDGVKVNARLVAKAKAMACELAAR